MSELTRRTVLSGAAAAAAIAPLAAPWAAFAAAPPAGTQVPGWYRYKIGNFEVTVVTDGAPPRRGSTILVNIGCTMNSSAALTKMAAVTVASRRSR